MRIIEMTIHPRDDASGFVAIGGLLRIVVFSNCAAHHPAVDRSVVGNEVSRKGFADLTEDSRLKGRVSPHPPWWRSHRHIIPIRKCAKWAAVIDGHYFSKAQFPDHWAAQYIGRDN